MGKNNLYADLEKYLGEKGIAEADKSLERLKTALGDSFAGKTVLVAYGGGKDSSYMTAFVRYLQLKAQKIGETFKIKIVTNRQSHMPNAVMENIDRTFNALEMYGDPNVQLLVVDGDNVTVLNSKKKLLDTPIPQEVIERDKADLLMAGHLTYGDGRRTFCDSCNAYMQKGEAHAITMDGGADLIITGDSLRELVIYQNWINNIYAATSSPQGEKRKQSFVDYMNKIDAIASNYFEHIHGEDGKYDMPSLGGAKTKMFSVYKDTPYDAGSHRKMLDEFLGFKFDAENLAFSFTESDCSAPALMAYLHGLRTEKLYDKTYVDGVRQYVDEHAIPLMIKKQFPPDLIEIQKDLYSTPEKINVMRQKVLKHYNKRFGLTEDNFIAMVYSPFAEGAKNMDKYLQNEGVDVAELEQKSGLTVDQMGHLFTQKLLEAEPKCRKCSSAKRFVGLPSKISGR
jgi:hypothetical protein